MAEQPMVQELVSGRLHLQHGPIDVVLQAWGSQEARVAAYEAAVDRFGKILDELVGELAELRKPISEDPHLCSPVARRMGAACRPYRNVFVTPMAAVAGAVADEIKTVMLAAAPLQRLYVNNGGDIAVHIASDTALTVGVAGDFTTGDRPQLNGAVRLTKDLGVGGIATSGFRGRSFSLGIADSVTVLAQSAAAADAAATLIANAVTIESPKILRRLASELDPDSDLGCRPVTVKVGGLNEREVAAALDAGVNAAAAFRHRGLILGAALMLQRRTRTVGLPTRQLEQISP